MKIETVNGLVCATAETIEDVKNLLALVRATNPREAEPVNLIRKQKSHFVPERYKKNCPICGKRIKHLKVHIRRNHPVSA